MGLFGDSTSIWQSNIFNAIWFLLSIAFIAFFYFSYRRSIANVEQRIVELENMANEAKKITVQTAKDLGKPEKDPTQTINEIAELFVIPPVSADPRGILKKLDHLIESAEQRFKEVVKIVAPNADSEAQANIIMTMKGSIGIYNIAKFARHMWETLRKASTMQAVFFLQTMLPQFRKIASGYLEGTKALSVGKPLGDSVGAMIALHLIGNAPTNEIVEETVAAEKTIENRRVIIVKAKGPGGRVGRPGEAVEKIVKQNGNIARIVTVDAAMKLEGEKTGTIAEGIGAAIGDPGPQKARIENIATKRKIPLDAIAIKIGIEEAVMPMKKEIIDAVRPTLEVVKRAICRAPEGSTVLIVGVGNTVGVGQQMAQAEEK
ncbi:MAG: DUF1512 domain-containing protein [Euryarchaeota archaeon]|nr:DUF1512 domain-containing protein [Euryarchaeota archaeon]